MPVTLGELIGNPKLNQDALSVYNSDEPELRNYIEKTACESVMYNYLHDQKYREDLHNSRLGKYVMKQVQNDISQDVDQGLKEFSNLILGPRRPMRMASMYMTTIPVSKPTYQFRYFNSKGRAEKTSRGKYSYQSRGDRGVDLEIKLKEEINTSDKVDRNFYEDNAPAVVSHYLSSIATSHYEEVDEMYTKQIAQPNTSFSAAGTGTWTDSSGNTHNKGLDFDVSSDADVPKLDSIIDGLSKARAAHWVPDCILMNWTSMGALLKTADYKDTQYFQHDANWSDGTIPMVLGMKVFATSQTGVNDNEIYLWEKNRYAVCAMRRNALVTAFEEREAQKEGVVYSTRLGFAHLDGAACVKIR